MDRGDLGSLEHEILSLATFIWEDMTAGLDIFIHPMITLGFCFISQQFE